MTPRWSQRMLGSYSPELHPKRYRMRKADGMPEYVERVTKNYLATREDGEQFADWAFRVEEELIK